ncbi:MAG: bifunctional fucokinase/L-fucose-1-P-guanylyltransferase [Bacteroidetes bacterium]|nr:bifunctional fucokinase/L-fucose-1-P-guanylyltransferase [Bacteroidota bacterium]
MQIQRLISLPPGMVSHFHKLEDKDPREWYCDSDPIEKKVGSGGGTASVLASAFRAEQFEGTFGEWLPRRKRMVIHSGGESRRLPAYAPYGKSLLPMPVFRWSKGQYIDQKLIDFQVSFYEKILKQAPDGYTTLVGSGDVMFVSGDRFNYLPEADVLVFGIWVNDSVAEKHGVFFSPKEEQDQLAFVKQKPTREELGEYSKDYFYLMDSGIVLLNAETTQKLMEKSGWNEEKGDFNGEFPDFYDLYGDMLTSFGSEARDPDPLFKGLDVRLVPLSEGEFYHFGSNRDLIESNLKLQNRVIDQRLKYTRETDHHPSIFQQSSQVGLRFKQKNHHIWIENSHVPHTWKLKHHHMITGVPENSWKLELPEDICLDVVHLPNGEYCLRTYGFDDGFRGSAEEDVMWMGSPLKEWFKSRSVNIVDAGLNMSDCIFDLPLFPVVEKEGIPAMAEWMVAGIGSSDAWTSAGRLSARELSERTDPMALYSHREILKAYTLTELAKNHHKSIFYFLDLERCAEDFRMLGLDMPHELPPGEPIVKQINDHMFRGRVYGNRTLASSHEKQAFGILREELMDTLRSQGIHPERNVLDDQILWGRSPVRLDLAGGWTDTPPYCILEGGKVVNLSVELNGQLPLQVFARPLEEPKIILRSIDLGVEMEITSFDDLRGYNRVGGEFSIPIAALVLAGFGPGFSKKQYPDLSSQLKEFGCGIEMSLLAAIPKGSGLGTSSNLAATVLGTLSEFCGLNWDKHDVAYRTLILEQMLTSGGGWQDQYGGIFPGVKLLETTPGILQKPSIKWLSDQLFSNRETREMMLLYYTGVTRMARDILGEIVKGMFLNSSGHLAIFSEMQEHAKETFETMLRNDYQGVASMVAHSWELNQRLDEGTNPEVIREITGRVDDLLLGYKLLGAGGGGYLMMFAKSADAAVKVKQMLTSNPPNTRARFVDFKVSQSGFQVSRS